MTTNQNNNRESLLNRDFSSFIQSPSLQPQKESKLIYRIIDFIVQDEKFSCIRHLKNNLHPLELDPAVQPLMW